MGPRRPLRGAAAAAPLGGGASLGWTVLVARLRRRLPRVAAGGRARGTVFLDAMFFLVALALPLLLVWLAAWLAEELDRQREIVAALAEVTAPLFDALAATRDALDRHGAASPEAIGRAVQAAMLGARPDLAVPLDRLLAGQARIEAALQSSPPRRARAVPAPPGARSGRPRRRRAPAPAPAAAPGRAAAAPARGGGAGAAGLADLVRALDFPRDADDRDGFRALRSALRHHGLAQMLQAAEDVLNLLSQEGVFVDELPMEPVDAAAWRRFIAGVRGPEVAGLGGIRDPRALEAARGADEDRLDLPRHRAVLPAPLRRRARRVRRRRRRRRARGARRHPLRPRLHAARPPQRLARLDCGRVALRPASIPGSTLKSNGLMNINPPSGLEGVRK